MRAVKGFKIYKATDVDWVMARDPSECEHVLKHYYGDDYVSEIHNFGPPEELTDDQVKRLIFKGDGRDRQFITELKNRLKARESTSPDLFATTEY